MAKLWVHLRHHLGIREQCASDSELEVEFCSVDQLMNQFCSINMPGRITLFIYFFLGNYFIKEDVSHPSASP